MPHQMMVAVFDTARHARVAMLQLVEADIPAHSITICDVILSYDARHAGVTFPGRNVAALSHGAR